MTYAEYLKSMGASEEEIKILDTAVARKAFDKSQSDIAAATQRAETERQNAVAYQDRATAWYNENNGALTKAKNDAVAAAADAARFRAAIITLQQQGLIDVAKDLGFKAEELTSVTPPANNPPANPGNGFDPTRYFTREDILQIAEREGEAIATAQDIAAEHSILFPGQRLNFRDLRTKAVAQKKSVEAVWMDEFKVPDARKARDESQREAERKKWKEEGAREAEAALASRFGNPDMRPLEPSVSAFAPRTSADPRHNKQPWEVGTPEQLSDIRARKGTEAVLKHFSGGRTN